MLRQLFYKTANDFASQYDVNVLDVLSILKDTKLGVDEPKAELLGMTEASLLKKLNLWIEVDGVDTLDDPRNLVYIILV